MYSSQHETVSTDQPRSCRAAGLLVLARARASQEYDGGPSASAGSGASPSAAEMASQQQADAMGLASIQVDGEEVAVNICLLGVLPHFQRQGVASALVQQVKNAARRSSAALIFLHVATGNAAALTLYRRLGFEVTATLPGYYKYDDDDDSSSSSSSSAATAATPAAAADELSSSPLAVTAVVDPHDASSSAEAPSAADTSSSATRGNESSSSGRISVDDAYLLTCSLASSAAGVVGPGDHPSARGLSSSAAAQQIDRGGAAASGGPAPMDPLSLLFNLARGGTASGRGAAADRSGSGDAAAAQDGTGRILSLMAEAASSSDEKQASDGAVATAAATTTPEAQPPPPGGLLGNFFGRLRQVLGGPTAAEAAPTGAETVQGVTGAASATQLSQGRGSSSRSSAAAAAANSGNKDDEDDDEDESPGAGPSDSGSAASPPIQAAVQASANAGGNRTAFSAASAVCMSFTACAAINAADVSGFTTAWVGAASTATKGSCRDGWSAAAAAGGGGLRVQRTARRLQLPNPMMLQLQRAQGAVRHQRPRSLPLRWPALTRTVVYC